MPIGFIEEIFVNGVPDVPYLKTGLQIVSWLLVVALLKRYFGGARSTSERNMHSKVIMMTVRYTMNGQSAS